MPTVVQIAALPPTCLIGQERRVRPGSKPVQHGLWTNVVAGRPLAVPIHPQWSTTVTVTFDARQKKSLLGINRGQVMPLQHCFRRRQGRKYTFQDCVVVPGEDRCCDCIYAGDGKLCSGMGSTARAAPQAPAAHQAAASHQAAAAPQAPQVFQAPQAALQAPTTPSTPSTQPATSSQPASSSQSIPSAQPVPASQPASPSHQMRDVDMDQPMDDYDDFEEVMQEVDTEDALEAALQEAMEELPDDEAMPDSYPEVGDEFAALKIVTNAIKALVAGNSESLWIRQMDAFEHLLMVYINTQSTPSDQSDFLINQAWNAIFSTLTPGQISHHLKAEHHPTRGIIPARQFNPLRVQEYAFVITQILVYDAFAILFEQGPDAAQGIASKISEMENEIKQSLGAVLGLGYDWDGRFGTVKKRRTRADRALDNMMGGFNGLAVLSEEEKRDEEITQLFDRLRLG